MAEETSAVETKTKASLGEMLKSRKVQVAVLIGLIVLVAAIWGMVFFKMSGSGTSGGQAPVGSPASATGQAAAGTQDALSTGDAAAGESAVVEDPRLEEYMDKTFKYRDPFKGN